MKKILSIFLSLTMVVTVLSCMPFSTAASSPTTSADVVYLDPYDVLVNNNTANGTVKQINQGCSLTQVTDSLSSKGTAYNERTQVYTGSGAYGRARMDFFPLLSASVYDVYVCISGWDKQGYGKGVVNINGVEEELNWGKLGSIDSYPEMKARVSTDANGDKWFYLKTAQFTGTSTDTVKFSNVAVGSIYVDTLKFVKVNTDNVVLDPYAYLVNGDESAGKVVSNGKFTLTNLSYSKSGYAYGQRKQEYFAAGAAADTAQMFFYPKLSAGEYMIYMCVNGFDNESYSRTGFQVFDNPYTDANWGHFASNGAALLDKIVAGNDGYNWFPIGKYTFTGNYGTDVVKLFNCNANLRSHVDALKFVKVNYDEVIVDPYDILVNKNTMYGTAKMINTGYTLTDVSSLGKSTSGTAYNGRTQVYHGASNLSYGQAQIDFSPALQADCYDIYVCVNGFDKETWGASGVKVNGEADADVLGCNWGELGTGVFASQNRVTTDADGNKWLYLRNYNFTGTSTDTVSIYNTSGRTYVDTLKFVKNSRVDHISVVDNTNATASKVETSAVLSANVNIHVASGLPLAGTYNLILAGYNEDGEMIACEEKDVVLNSLTAGVHDIKTDSIIVSADVHTMKAFLFEKSSVAPIFKCVPLAR